MSIVITIVATNKKLIEDAKIKIISDLISLNIDAPDVIKLGRYAVDFYISSSSVSIDTLKKKINRNITNLSIDLCIQKNINRRKKLVAFDMDMTVFMQESIDLIAKKFNLENKIAPITKKSMSGKINFTKSILTRTKLLKGINIEDIKSIFKKKLVYTPGALEVIRTMNKAGAHTMLISGGYKVVADIIGKKLGFKEIIANNLSYKNNILDGNLSGKIIDKKNKLLFLQNRMNNIGLNSTDILAVGDGANDIDMISFAELGIAWKAYPVVQEKAKFLVNYDFKSILYFQGYKDEEIIK